MAVALTASVAAAGQPADHHVEDRRDDDAEQGRLTCKQASNP
jgi:hypothetical protein